VAGNVTINAEDLVVAERLIRSAMEQYAPAGNFRPGSFLNDVVIRALAYLPALMEREADTIRNRQSLLRIGDLDVTEATAALEDLASNWFLTRKTGSAATGTVTVHLSPEVGEDVTVPLTAELVYDTGVVFSVDSSTALVFGRDSHMTAVLDSTGSVAEYLLYVPVICQIPGAAGNIAAGRFASYDAFSPYITYIEAETNFDTAVDGESNTALLERSKTAVATRNLVTARSIDTVLKDEVASVYEVTVVGAGDVEMRRDIVEISVGDPPATQIRVLGHVNVYCLLPIRKAVLYPLGGSPATVDELVNELTLTTNAVTGLPYARIKRVIVDGTNYTRVNGTPAQDSSTYAISVTDPKLFGSLDQEVRVLLPNLTVAAEREVLVEFDGFRDLYNVDVILSDRNRRVANANTLAYAHIPVVTSISINYYLSADAPGALPVADAKASIATYINTTQFSGNLRVTDIVTYFLGQYSTYVRGVGYPVTVNYSLEAPNGDQIHYQTTDKVTVEDSSLLNGSTYSDTDRVAHQVSDRTVKVVTFEDLITLTAVT